MLCPSDRSRPSPWYEHAGHQTNFSELQDRMTDAEQTARSAAASMSQMQATVSQILVICFTYMFEIMFG